MIQIKINVNYKAAGTGVETPIYIKIKRISPQTLLKYQTQNRDERDGWCLTGKQCSKFGKRPCCPPAVKMFSDMKPRKNFYLVCISCNIQDYWDTHPKVAEHANRQYFAMQGSHIMTRSILARIIRNFGGQHFRVGGCLGCQYPKTGVCKHYSPSLEAAGINVVELAKDVLNYEIQWWDKDGFMGVMRAIGGVYTDKTIPPEVFKKIILRSCNK